jgi:hypothetical protein
MKPTKSKLINTDKIELRADGWERFREAVHAAAKSGPKHRQPKDDWKERQASKRATDKKTRT